MATVPFPAPLAVTQALELELSMVREAIVMVANGAAPRVVIGGLRFGEALIDPARRLGRESGIRVVPLWTAAAAGADIAIERIADD